MDELSQDAQGAVDAFNECYELCGLLDGNWDRMCLAAAFRFLTSHGETLFDPHEGKVSVVRIERIEALVSELEGWHG